MDKTDTVKFRKHAKTETEVGLREKSDLILDSLKSLGTDFTQNLRILTKLACELLQADCATYNKVTGDTIINVCSWNAPDDFVFDCEPQNHICYDIIIYHSDDYCHLKDLQTTKYADSDLAIKKYGFETYIGHKVYSGETSQSIISTLFTTDFEPSVIEKKIIELIAVLIGREESRANADQSSKTSEVNYQQLYALLRLICDNEPDMIWAKDIQKKYLFTNRALCEGLLCAVDTDEPIGKTDMFFADRERNSQPDNPDWHTFGEICRDTDQITMEAMTQKRFDEFGNIRGKFLRLDVFKAPLLDMQGKLIGTVGSARDVTQDKTIEQALIDSQERYKALLDANPDLMFLFSKNRVFLDYKAENGKVLLMPPEDFMGKTLNEVLPPELAALTCQVIEKTRVTGKVQNYEYSLIFEGEKLYFDARMAPCGDDKFLAIVRDITERKKAELALTASETMFRRVVETSNEGIWIMDKDSHTTYANQMMLEMLECELSDMLGKSIVIWMYEEGRTEHEEKLLEREKGHKDTYERRYRTKTGKEIWAYVSATAILDDEGNFQGSFGMFTDITQRKQMDKALQDSEERYRVILEHSPVCIALHSEGKVVYANPASLKLFAAENVNQLIGMHVREFMHPDCLEAGTSNLKKLMQGETVLYPVEYMFKRLDGTYFQVEVYANVLRYQDKPAIQIMVSDITERKAAQVLALKNQARLKSIVDIQQLHSESMPDLLKYAMDEAIKLTDSYYGYLFFYREEKQEFEIFTWSQTALAESAIESRKQFYPLAETGIWGEVVRQNKPMLINDFQSPNPLKKGMPIGHVKLTRFMAIPIYSEGKIVATLGVANKVTDYEETDLLQLTLLMDTVWKIVDRKKHEDELRKLTRAVEQSPVSIIITDICGKIEYVSEFFTKVTGYTREEIIGKTPRILNSGETSAETYKTLWDTINSGKIWNGEFHNKKKNGELYWEEASISPVADKSGKITHFIAVKEDITHRKQITQELITAKEAAEQMSRVKSTFLANMSHELRTPLVGILGFSELLPGVVENPEALDMAKMINTSGKRLLNTLNLILDLSRIEANKQEIKWQTIDLNQFLSRIIRLFEAVAQGKKLSLQFMSQVSELSVLTDPALLEHVVNDLINNAIKYTNIGSIMVRSKLDLHDKENYIQITVTDTGIGIPKQQQAVIFDAFRQASEGYERTYEGTGLGLTISRKYIELLGGKISVNSEPGLGSEFMISFPQKYFQSELPEGEDNEIEDEMVNAGSTPEPVQIPRILLIDDDPISLMLTSRMLAGIAEVDYAPSGESGLQLIHERQYPAILLDINLRKTFNGIGVMDDIRKIPAYHTTPIVAVTAYSMVGDKEEFLARGFSHYLSKPYSKDELTALIQEILDGSNA